MKIRIASVLFFQSRFIIYNSNKNKKNRIVWLRTILFSLQEKFFSSQQSAAVGKGIDLAGFDTCIA